MKQQKYNMISGVLFTLHALAAIFVIGFNSEILVDGVAMPAVMLYSGAFLSLLMAYSSFKLLK